MSISTLLDAMSNMLWQLDPMGCHSPYNDEYDSVALSILSRLNECFIEQENDAECKLEATKNIVVKVFQIWFNGVPTNYEHPVWDDVAVQMLKIYETRYE